MRKTLGVNQNVLLSCLSLQELSCCACVAGTYPLSSLLSFGLFIGKPTENTATVVKGSCSTVYYLIMIAFYKGMGSKKSRKE